MLGKRQACLKKFIGEDKPSWLTTNQARILLLPCVSFGRKCEKGCSRRNLGNAPRQGNHHQRVDDCLQDWGFARRGFNRHPDFMPSSLWSPMRWRSGQPKPWSNTLQRKSWTPKRKAPPRPCNMWKAWRVFKAPPRNKNKGRKNSVRKASPWRDKKNLAHSLPKIFKSKARRTEMALEQTDFTTSLEAWAKILRCKRTLWTGCG